MKKIASKLTVIAFVLGTVSALSTHAALKIQNELAFPVINGQEQDDPDPTFNPASDCDVDPNVTCANIYEDDGGQKGEFLRSDPGVYNKYTVTGALKARKSTRLKSSH